jgi:regulator of protease activity HflC (stomatin/prohibitin superfamily)|tara:strand:+ start:1453 stop:2295 length:843 start_codon:yes stop_codon:yes gene_type:complete
MVMWMLIAIPVILVFGGLGLIVKSPKNLILGKIMFEFKEYERGVVYRFGKYHRVAEPGWRFVIPMIETFVKYDLRTETIDIPPQTVITKDAVKLNIDAIIYLRVDDPVKAELYVEEDYRKAIEEHVKGRIRNLVGSMEIDELYGKIDHVNNQLREDVQKLAIEWGVMIVNVELISVTPPQKMVDAMQAEEIAERYKRAELQEAETTKIRIGAIEAAAGQLTTPTLNYLYIKALKDVADGRSTKIVFPMELTKAVEKLAGGIGGNKQDLASAAEKLLEKIK